MNELDPGAEVTRFVGRMALVVVLAAALAYPGKLAWLSPDAARRRPARGQAAAAATPIAPADLARALEQASPELKGVVAELEASGRSPALARELGRMRERGELEKAAYGGVTYGRLYDELKDGGTGPLMYQMLAAAEANGDLDKIKVLGKSLKEYRDEARTLSVAAEEKKAASEKAQSEALGVDVSISDGLKTFSESLPLLDHPAADARRQGVMNMIDLRVAVYAQPALPTLERLAVSDPDPDVADMARVAAIKIKQCASSLLCQQKYRR